MNKTGIYFERCNVGTAEMHNTRDPQYIAAINASPNKHYSIFEDQTEKNVSWVNPKYEGKSLPGLLNELRSIYREKIGQAPQEQDRVRDITDKKTGMKKTVTTAGWSPIREGVCPIKADTTIADFGPFIEWLNSKGLQTIRIDLHHDEGHTDELTGWRKYNHHAHLIEDWIDHGTGKSCKLSKIDMSEMQTQLAASLGMERGESKAITGVKHLSAGEQRAKAAAEQAKNLETKIEGLRNQMSEAMETVAGVSKATDQTIIDCCKQLQTIGDCTVQNFDILCMTEAVKPTSKEKASRDGLFQESHRDLEQLRRQELIKEQLLLRNLILQTSRAIERIGRRLQDLAKTVPFWKKSRLSHEAELQTRVANAEDNSRKALLEAEKIRREAENAKIQASVAETRANTRERAASEAIRDFNKRIAQAVQDKDKEWRSWYDRVGKPAIDERNSLELRVEELEEELKSTKIKLAKHEYDAAETIFKDAKRFMIAVTETDKKKIEKDVLEKTKLANDELQKPKSTSKELIQATKIIKVATKSLVDTAKVRYDYLKDETEKQQIDAALAAAYYKPTFSEIFISRLLTLSRGSVFRDTHGNTVEKTLNERLHEKEKAEEEVRAKLHQRGLR